MTYSLFTDPPLARVGIGEREARQSGKRVLMGTRPMSKIGRAREKGETVGMVKLLVDADTDLFLGATVFGVGGDEVVNMITVCMTAGITAKQFRKTVLIHPTVAELIPWVLDDLQPLA
jgi:pyruvate/2-oxoglutarate dehydrogenase complex dihydrolipoamide dehydrogenase (E3) component